jgi:hypothetical protein
MGPPEQRLLANTLPHKSKHDFLRCIQLLQPPPQPVSASSGNLTVSASRLLGMRITTVWTDQQIAAVFPPALVAHPEIARSTAPAAQTTADESPDCCDNPGATSQICKPPPFADGSMKRTRHRHRPSGTLTPANPKPDRPVAIGGNVTSIRGDYTGESFP